MKKRNIKKLSVNKETLRSLSDAKMRSAVGGYYGVSMVFGPFGDRKPCGWLLP